MAGFQPEGWRTITPRICTDDVHGLAAFLRTVFGATGRQAAGRPLEMRIGDSIVMLSEAAEREPFVACLYVYVEDADKTYRKAISAGAKSVEKPTDTAYGDRRGIVRDDWGNTWQIATREAVGAMKRTAVRRR